MNKPNLEIKIGQKQQEEIHKPNNLIIKFYNHSKILKEISKTLNQKKSIRISLNKTEMVDNYKKIIDEKINSCPIELKLYIEQGYSMDDYFDYLNQAFKSCQNLTNLSFITYGQGEELSIQLSKFIPQWNQITHFSLCLISCQIRIQELCEALAKCTQLKSLNLVLPSTTDFDEGKFYQLSAAISQLKNLTQLNLDLSCAQIGEANCSNLGEAIASLEYLNDLKINLERSQIGAKCVYNIFQGVLSCKKLVSVDLKLQSNQLSFDDTFILSPVACNLQQIRIDLRFNKINKEGCQLIGQLISFFKSTKSFDLVLGNCQIDDECLLSIGKGISECIMLQDFNLDLSNNLIQTHGSISFAKLLATCSSLSSFSLNLMSNQIDQEIFHSYLEVLNGCQNLNSFQIFLNQNKIQSTHIENVANDLKNENITKIDLSIDHNQIDIQGIQTLTNSIIQCQKLIHLGLSMGGNQINDEGTSIISNMLPKMLNMNILKLNLYLNQISSEGLSLLAQSITKCALLSELHLNLDYNFQLSDQGALKLGEKIGSCQKLACLSLSLRDCQLTSSACLLMKFITNCKHLQLLDLNLQNNQIMDLGCQQLSEYITLIQNLNVLNLNLRESGITDISSIVLSKQISRCENLKYLKLNILYNSVRSNEYYFKIMKAPKLVQYDQY
ncbi:hypothetical protein ABPG74_007099 [Tetrahymena malaccensis]